MEKIFWQAQTHRHILQGKFKKLEEVRTKKNGLIIKKFLAYTQKADKKMLEKYKKRKNLKTAKISKLVDQTNYKNGEYTFYYELFPNFPIYKNESKIREILKKILIILIDCKKNNYLPLTLHPDFLMTENSEEFEKNNFDSFKLFMFGQEINESERFKNELDWKIEQYFDKETFERINNGKIWEDLESREKCLVFCIGIIFSSFLIDSSAFTLVGENGDFSEELYEVLLDTVGKFKLEGDGNFVKVIIDMVCLDKNKRPTLEECLKCLQ